MSASKPPIRGVFYPHELHEMRAELSRGDAPDETMEEREGRAQEIFERNRSEGEPLELFDKTPSPRSSTDTERHA